MLRASRLSHPLQKALFIKLNGVWVWQLRQKSCHLWPAETTPLPRKWGPTGFHEILALICPLHSALTTGLHLTRHEAPGLQELAVLTLPGRRRHWWSFCPWLLHWDLGGEAGWGHQAPGSGTAPGGLGPPNHPWPLGWSPSDKCLGVLRGAPGGGVASARCRSPVSVFPSWPDSLLSQCRHTRGQSGWWAHLCPPFLLAQTPQFC